MYDAAYIKQIIPGEIAGKSGAIHAYDKMMWSIRSGFYTLVFVGWSLIIKEGLDEKMHFSEILPYMVLLSFFSLSMAAGAFFIDRNYARRKFRVITRVNELMEFIMRNDLDHPTPEQENRLTEILKIAGESDAHYWESKGYNIEIRAMQLIYFTPSVIILFLLIYSLTKLIQ
jgi:hypothetical protein